MLSVHNLRGHIFQGDTGEGTESCLTCGGTWRYTDVTDPEFPTSVDRTYSANNGDAPEYCSGDTARVHGDAPCGYDNGRECQEAKASDGGTCRHTQHDCNCAFCA